VISVVGVDGNLGGIIPDVYKCEWSAVRTVISSGVLPVKKKKIKQKEMIFYN
jgi:hypothetical protein